MEEFNEADEIKKAIAQAILLEVSIYVNDKNLEHLAQVNRDWLIPSVEAVYKIFEKYGDPQQRELLLLRKRLSGK